MVDCTRRTLLKKKILTLIGGGIGNLLEWYDFLIYGFLASFLGPLFWNKGEGSSGVVYSLGIFAISYMARPIGSIFFGYFADRIGRKTVLIISSILIGTMTVLIGCLPTYQQIGGWAPILLLAARFLQGLSVGGEYMNSAIYLVEQASATARGRYGSVVNICGGIGSAWASLIVWLLALKFSNEEIQSWAWRLPFLIGIFNLVLSLFIRLKIDETPVFLSIEANHLISANPVLESFKTQKREMLISMCLVGLQGISFYIITVYFTFWMESSHLIPLTGTFTSTTFALIITLVMSLLSGYFSDKCGRRPLLLVGIIGLACAVLPVFKYLSNLDPSDGFLKFFASQGILAAFFGIYNGVLPATLVEIFQQRTRCSAMSMSYNVAAGIFGGTAPLISLFLVRITHTHVAPAFYLLFSAIIAGVTVIFFLKETYRSALP